MAKPTKRPLIRPHNPPTIMAVRIITRMELVILKATIVALVVNTKEEPMDRSICPVIMTKAIPRAMVPTIQVF